MTATPAHLIEGLRAVLQKHKPAAIWLVAPTSRTAHQGLIPALKELGATWAMKVIAQVPTVEAAVEAIDNGCHAVIAQTSATSGTSAANLVRQILELAKWGRDVPIIASGGIVDPRAVAAALALGVSMAAWISWKIISTEDMLESEAAESKDKDDTYVEHREWDRLKLYLLTRFMLLKMYLLGYFQN